MQPKDSGGGDGAGMSMEDKVKSILEEIMEKLPDDFNLYELHQKVEEKTPYVVVALQEAERMNNLISVIRTSLKVSNITHTPFLFKIVSSVNRNIASKARHLAEEISPPPSGHPLKRCSDYGSKNSDFGHKNGKRVIKSFYDRYYIDYIFV